VRDNLHKAAERRKVTYDAKVRKHEFVTNTWVWYYNPEDSNNNSRTYAEDPAGPDPPPGTDATEVESRNSQDLVPDSQPPASSQVAVQAQSEVEVEAEVEVEQSEVFTQVPAAEREKSVQSKSLAREPERSSSGRDKKPRHRSSRERTPDAQRRRESRHRSRSSERRSIDLSVEELELFQEFRKIAAPSWSPSSVRLIPGLTRLPARRATRAFSTRRACTSTGQSLDFVC